MSVSQDGGGDTIGNDSLLCRQPLGVLELNSEKPPQNLQ